MLDTSKDAHLDVVRVFVQFSHECSFIAETLPPLGNEQHFLGIWGNCYSGIYVISNNVYSLHTVGFYESPKYILVTKVVHTWPREHVLDALSRCLHNSSQPSSFWIWFQVRGAILLICILCVVFNIPRFTESYPKKVYLKRCNFVAVTVGGYIYYKSKLSMVILYPMHLFLVQW